MVDDEHDKRRSPHDRLARRILSDPEAAGVELRHVLPAKLAERLDFADIRIEPESFVDRVLDEGRSDILYSIAFKDSERRALIYVLLEHQSTPDPLMPWRMLEYIVWIWQRWFTKHKGPVRKIPLIIPVVLAQCENGWTAPYRLSELFDLPDDLREDFVSPVEVELTIDEVSDAIVQDQRARNEVLVLVQLMRMLLFAHHHGDRFTEDQLLSMTGMFRTVRRDLGADVTVTLWFYVVSVFGPESPFRRMLLDVIDEEQRQMHDAAKSKWLAEGGAEWVAEHYREQILEKVQEQVKEQLQVQLKEQLQVQLKEQVEKKTTEIIAKSRASAKAELLLDLLEQRKLPIAPATRERVLDTTDELQLQRWFQRAVTAGSIDEVFEPPS